MPSTALQPTSPRINFKLYLGLPIMVAISLLLLELTDIDMVLERLFYDPIDHTFAGKHSYWLETVLHDRAKQFVIAIGVFAAVGYFASYMVKRLLTYRREFAFVVVAMTLSTSYTAPIKTLTGVQCPWDLTEFGGQQVYTKLLQHRPPTDDPGRCWPGGHAATGFTLFTLFFAFRNRSRRWARRSLVFAFALGTVFSIGRMIQGAHFLSHNIWAATFCWLICLGTYYVMLYRPKAVEITEPQPAIA